MKKLTKRMLSIFLSAVMVFTTVPFTALTAYANSTDVSANLKARFFSTSNIWHDDVSGANDAMEWIAGDTNYDSTDGMHDLSNNGYLRIKPGLNVTSGISASTGATISFAFRKDNNDWHRHILSFGANQYSGSGNASSNSFYIAGTTSWMANNNGYGDNSLFLGYVNDSGTELLNCYPDYHFEVGKVYHCTITITSSAINYYINGAHCDTLHSGDTYTSANLTAALNSLGTYNQNYVGIGRWGDGTFSGSLRNMTIYDKALSVQELTDEMAKDMLSNYEAMMSGATYKNMEAAYSAYVDLNEAWDAYTYGDSVSAPVLTACHNLADAMTNMTPWDGYRGTFAPTPGTFTNDQTGDAYANNYAGHYNNLLYLPRGQGSMSGGNDQNYLRVYISTPSKVVALYDGVSIAKYPAMPIVQSNGGSKPRGLSCFYIGDSDKSNNEHNGTTTNSYIYFDSPWHWGGAGNYDFTWNEAQSGESIPYTYSTTSTSSTVSGGYKYLSGHICIKNDNISFASGNYSTTPANYSKTLSGTVYFQGRNYDSATHTYTSQNLNYITIVNYKPVYDLINDSTNKAKLAAVEDYKEGGLLSLVQAYTTAQNFDPNSYDYSSSVPAAYGSAMQGVVNAFSGVSTTTDVAANYIALRAAFDNTANPTATPSKETTVRAAYAAKTGNSGENTLGFSRATFSEFVTAYENARDAMAYLVTEGAYYYTYNGSSISSIASTLNAKYNALAVVNIVPPTINVMGESAAEAVLMNTTNNEITITNVAGKRVDYTVAYDGGSATPYNFTTATKNESLFTGANASATTAVVTAKTYDSVEDDYSETVIGYYRRILPPVTESVQELGINEEAVVATGNTGFGTTIEYSNDGGSTWNELPYKPFGTGASSNATATASFRENKNGVYSPTVSVNFYRKGGLLVASAKGGSVDAVNGANFYVDDGASATFTLANTGTYSGNIKYMVNIDGVESAELPYDKTADEFTISSGASFVTVTAWAEGASDQKTVTTLINSANYSTLIYRESFDGATVSGTTMTSAQQVDSVNSGVNLSGDGLLGVESGAGYIDSRYSASPDWRNNVIKVNAEGSSTSRVQFASNPFRSTNINKAAAKANGVTISFWRHMEDTSGATQDTGIKTLCGLSINKDNSHYFDILPSADVCYSNGAVNGSGDYLDIDPEPQDATLHAAGNYNGKWVNIVVTIDPNSGIQVYTNGDPHKYNFAYDNANSSFKTNESAELAQAVLDLITDSGANIYLEDAHGIGSWQKSGTNVFYDDIRIYTEVKSQVDIYNMYNDRLADVQGDIQNTSHDPTAVTVYTLKSNNKKVGVEYIEAHNIADEDIKSIEYYNFGTGMTVYRSTDNVNWEVIGDRENRCGYQNQDLFDSDGNGDNKYWEELANCVAWVDTTGTQVAGAGRLVWAPHVMYNIDINKWVYYGSMSSWGSQRSAIFMATSDYPDHGYHYETMVYKSSAGPNAIDPVVFYDADYRNLYMIWGSWITGVSGPSTSVDTDPDGEGNFEWAPIVGVPLNADGTYNGTYTTHTEDTSLRTDNNVSAMDGSKPIARGLMSDLERPDGQKVEWGSAEGAYVVHETVGNTTYYYLYVSYGQNTGTYTERVFRATSPLGPYRGYNGLGANNKMDNAQATAYNGTKTFNRGNQILAPFDIKLYNYLYVSTGHNSVYKVKNDNGEWVTLNSVHARPYADARHDWKAISDAALAKRQSEVTGNVCLNNLMAYNKDGWPVLFPAQYDGSDSIEREITAYDLEGIYTADDFGLYVIKDTEAIHSEYTFTMLATDATHGTAYGTKTLPNGQSVQFLSDFEITHPASGPNVNYLTLTDRSDGYVRYQGVIASQAETVTVNGRQKVIKTPMIGMMNEYPFNDTSVHATNRGEMTWAYRSADIPDIDKVISHGDLVSSSGVIYTHASEEQALAVATVNKDDYSTDAAFAREQKRRYNNPSAYTSQIAGLSSDAHDSALNTAYAVYGQEISDNWDYGQKVDDQYTAGGERFTTFDIAYPGYVPIDSTTGIAEVGSVISLNDTEYCRDYNETGSNITAVPLYDGWWCTKNSDGTYTKVTNDDAAARTNGTTLYKVYGLEGTVSTFFRYYDNEEDGAHTLRNGYPKVGVSLVINYKQYNDEGTSTSDMSAFEFMYVMPNPAWAHTLAAIKNNHSDVGNDRNSSYGTFNRFEESYGTATDYYSSMLYYATHTDTFINGYGHGISGYLTDFATSATGKDLNTLDKIKTLYNFYDTSIGVNSGTFSAQEHNDKYPNAYTATPDTVNVRYYVDYSDTSNYIVNNPNTGLITSEGGVPTGYRFKMKTANFLWQNYANAAIFDVTSYARNTTGLNVTYSGTAVDSNGSDYLAHINDDAWHDSRAQKGGIYTTNLAHFNSDVTWGGKKTWVADEMLFHADERNNSDAIFGNSYRNRYLYYFTNNAPLVATTADKNDDGWIDGNKSTRPSFHDYSGMTAYTTAANGKLPTNTWQGTATFTGRDRVTPPTYRSVTDPGYWYKHDTGNADNREDYTPDLATAQAGKTYGTLDVSAEYYANYILEMGSYHKVSDTGVDGGRFLGKENYHYYNIGVATCDKGAARDFMETYALKRLKCRRVNGKRVVKLDANGRPEIETATPVTTTEANVENFIEDLGDTQGNLYVENTSAKSYRDYIDALARLEWFVNNPTNTVQNDLAGEDEYIDAGYADVMTSSDEYVTSYVTDTHNSSLTVPAYLTTVGGDNVFDEDVTTTNTDAVQAKLIADVIEAYENLYTVDDYKEVEKEYVEIKNEVMDAEGLVQGDYTDESKTNYKNGFDAVEKAVAYYTSNTGVTDESLDEGLIDTSDDDYWRYSEYSGADYEAIREALEELKDSLMPKVNSTVLQATVGYTDGESVRHRGKEDDVIDGIYTNGVQTKRYDQWAALHDEVLVADSHAFGGTANTGVIQTTNGAARYTASTTPKYIDAVLGTTEEERAGTDYPYYVYRLESAPTDHDDVHYVSGTDLTDDENGKTVYVAQSDGTYAILSANQASVNAENTTLGSMTIDDVDNDSAYLTYDSAYSVVSAIDFNKYIPSDGSFVGGEAQIRAELAKRSEVYTEKTSAIRTLYNSIVSGEGKTMPDDGKELRCTGLNETDPYTNGMLTIVNTVDSAPATYINEYSASVVYVDSNGDDLGYTSVTGKADNQQKYYGDVFSFTVPEEARGKSTISMTYTDLGQQKSMKWTYGGDTIDRIATGDVAITIKLRETETEGTTKVVVKNGYGTIVHVAYVADPSAISTDGMTINFGSSTYTADYIPFYTFSTWTVTTEGDTVVYKATYNTAETVSTTVPASAELDGYTPTSTTETTAVYQSQSNDYVTLKATDEIENFVAWATVSAYNGKYQIASYSSEYKFYTVANETFVAVTEGADGYYVGETKLSSANVDVTIPDVDSSMIDEVINQKLDNKAPFISLVKTQSFTTADNGKYKAYAYLRVTEGAEIPKEAYGVVFTFGGNSYTFSEKNILTSGQFTSTMRKSSSPFDSPKFKGFVTYNFTFIGEENDGTDIEQDLSLRDYTAEVNCEIV